MLSLCCICGLDVQSGQFIDTVKSLSSTRAIGKLENRPEFLWLEQFNVEFESQQAYVPCNLVYQNHSSSEIFMHKLTAVCIDPLIWWQCSKWPSQPVWQGRFVAKHFVMKYQVLDCMIVQQNMVTLCNSTQNYNLQHKKTVKLLYHLGFGSFLQNCVICL